MNSYKGILYWTGAALGVALFIGAASGIFAMGFYAGMGW